MRYRRSKRASGKGYDCFISKFILFINFVILYNRKLNECIKTVHLPRNIY